MKVYLLKNGWREEKGMRWSRKGETMNFYHAVYHQRTLDLG
jgi:hypothetical protein